MNVGKDSARKDEEPRKESLNIRLSSIMTVVFLGIVAIALAYVGGVMSGRQIGPEETRSHIEENVPENEKKAQEGQIIPAEDLEFARVLRGEQKKNPEPAPKPLPEQQESVPSAPSQETEIQQPAVEKPASERQSELQDYIFQAGAFRDEQGADRLRQSLEGFGLRTRMEKNGKMFIVLILLRGTEERAEELKRIAGDLKLGDLILRSRKPAR